MKKFWSTILIIALILPMSANTCNVHAANDPMIIVLDPGHGGSDDCVIIRLTKESL